MARFFVRIQLDGRSSDDARYEELHSAMERAGFSREIRTSNGLRWLPHATYVTTSAKTLEDVWRAAQAAAKEVQPKFEVLVVESDRWTSSGMRPAE